MGSSKATDETGEDLLQRFEPIVNVGAAMAKDFFRPGVHSRPELKGRDPLGLDLQLYALAGVRQDPYGLDVLKAGIGAMGRNSPRKWWRNTDTRKVKYAGHYESPLTPLN